MLEGQVRVVNHLGLHARAAGQLVKLAGRFRSRIILKKPDGSVEVDARSMLDVLTLAAPANTLLILSVEGADEKKAFASVRGLFESGFGES